MARDLLVPGTGGTKLLLDGDDIGWPGELTVAGWLAKQQALSLGFEALGAKYGSPENIGKVLSLQYGDDPMETTPLKTTLWPNGNITPGPELHLVYNQFGGFQPFLYDWRQDIRRSADQLLKTLTGSPGERWRIVCHSQGGLVVVAAAYKFAEDNGNDDRAFARLVSHVAFIAVPFHGTVMAADAFINGETLAGPVADTFKQVARTWPALYQMLPTWLGSVKTAVAGGDEVTDQTNLLADAPWAGQQLIPSMLERARKTRPSLRAPMAYLNGINKRIFQSRAHPTPDHVVRDGGKLRVAGKVAGDTLVPDDITRRMGGALQSQLTLSFGQLEGPGSGGTMVHSAMAVDPNVASAVKDFFQQ